MDTFLEKRDPIRNQARFYWMSVQPNLFGEWVLQRRWGRIGQRGGQERLDWYATEGEAETALHELERVKRRRGYGADAADQKVRLIRPKVALWSGQC